MYNRSVQIDKHVCQLIYSTICFLIVKMSKLGKKWWLYNLCLSLPSSFFLSSNIFSSILFRGRFNASLALTCKMMNSGLCREIGFILSCMSLTLAPGKLFTLICVFGIFILFFLLSSLLYFPWSITFCHNNVYIYIYIYTYIYIYIYIMIVNSALH